VFCTQNPLKNVLVGKKHEFLVGSIIDDEPGLPLHIKLSTLPPPKAETFIPNALNAESSMQQKLDTRSRSGIPFEMAICGSMFVITFKKLSFLQKNVSNQQWHSYLL